MEGVWKRTLTEFGLSKSVLEYNRTYLSSATVRLFEIHPELPGSNPVGANFLFANIFLFYLPTFFVLFFFSMVHYFVDV